MVALIGSLGLWGSRPHECAFMRSSPHSIQTFAAITLDGNLDLWRYDRCHMARPETLPHTTLAAKPC